VSKPSDEQKTKVRMSGYRPHEPDLFEDPHHWRALLYNPHEVLCGICGEIQHQNEFGSVVWTTVRKGR
jgi:hypothetical protein